MLTDAGTYSVEVIGVCNSVTNSAVLTVFEADFGDAFGSSYPTLLANNGARHLIVPNVYLGSGVDSESDGQPDVDGMGDDLAGSDDEDGVFLTMPLITGILSTAAVNASSGGLLNAWIDYNGDGDWSDPGEHIFVDETVTAGANLLTFTVPLTATPGSTFARFRFSTVGGLSFDGEAPDGEVEDYHVAIVGLSMAEKASLNGDVQHPRITGVRLQAADVVISFTTQAGQNYRLECTHDLDAGEWTAVVDGVPGTGSTVQVTDTEGARH